MSVLKTIDLKRVALIVVGVICTSLIWFVPGMVAPVQADMLQPGDVDPEVWAMVVQFGLQALGLVPEPVIVGLKVAAAIGLAGSWIIDPFVKDETISKWSPWLRLPFDLFTGRVGKAKRFK